ncbi:MAG: hypothetical protein QXJ07_06340 [Candidatus Bathyarchaeia archaeon]
MTDLAKCQNPFFHCEGKSNRIAVDIIYKGERLSICQDCWNKIAESDITWTNTQEDLDLRAKDLRLWTE